MLTKHTPKNREQLEMITLAQLVPNTHLFRKVKATIDFPSSSTCVAANAYFCCNEPKEYGQSVVEKAKNGLKQRAGKLYLRKK